MVPCAEEVGEGGGGTQPGTEGHAVLGAVQRGQALLQGVAGRVAAAGVLVPERE